MSKLSKEKLNEMFRQAEEVDRETRAHMRSNIRLVAGEHFPNIKKRLDRSSAGRQLPSDVRLRLTQNHIARASNVWVNEINSAASDVEIIPDNPRELRDKKAAELFRSVKAHIAENDGWSTRKPKLVKDFFDIGEAVVKLTWEPDEGPLVNKQIPMVNEVGEVLLDEFGNPLIQTIQVPGGKLHIERILPFDMLRDPAAKDWEDCRWMCLLKLLDKKDLLNTPGLTMEQQESIRESKDETYRIYDTTNSEYKQETRTMVREFYFKPCRTMPNGWFVITTQDVILFEGELPGGIFPIEVVNFNETPTSPRGISKIKDLRGPQLEINRCVSKMAEHQITIGDDILIAQNGIKISEGTKLNGIRFLQTQLPPSQAVQTIPGRSGDQYVPYWLNQIQIFNQIAELPEIAEDKLAGMDPMAIMLLSARQKKKYSIYAEKFEVFLQNIWMKALKLFKIHCDPDVVIPIVGKHEQINIDELKSSDDLGFQIKIKPRTDDPESLASREFRVMQYLQYAGSQLSQSDLGELLRQSPFLDKENFASEATLNYDRATNMILKMDQGIDLPISSQDDPVYMLKRLDKRMSESDFLVMDQGIQQLYGFKKQQYEELLAQNIMTQQMAQLGQIPMTGNMVPVQMYETVPKENGGFKVTRVYFNHDALVWLRQALVKQGMTQETLQGFQPGVQRDINEMLSAQQMQGQEEVL